LAAAVLAHVALAGAAGSSGALPPLNPTTSLLVVAPHPDDETLCCAGAIQQAIASGGRVSVVWITSGDGSELSMLMVERSLFAPAKKVRDLAARRMREARAATSLLGLQSPQQLFLGYPDGGIMKLLTENRSTLYRAKFTGATHVPYSDTLFPGHPYTGQSLEMDFAAVLDRIKPTLVLAPSLADTHPDHRASGLLTMRVLAQRGESSKARYWIVHGGEGWPNPREYVPSIPLNTPARGRELPWKELDLSDDQETDKLQAIRAYGTQMKVMSPFLLAFVRTSELYSADPGQIPMP